MTDLTQRTTKLSPARLRLLKHQLQRTRPPYEPIAIVGMGCRFPGAPDLESYWRVLSEAERAIGPIPDGRWDHDQFFDAAGGVGRTNVSEVGFIEGVDQFDAPFFGIAPREAAKMDPQQRILLEVTWEALEHAGLAPEGLTGSSTGVFVGIGAADYAKVPLSLDDYYGQIDAHSGTGNALSIAANRISYLFDWHGPSLSIDTACSSSLVALHAAAKSLQNGEADLAVAGGANLILAPETMIAFSNARMLSPDGHCRPFDARANGYVRGEGVGVVVLKRLTDAVADGDRVLAVISGSAVNQDGRTSGMTSPNSGSQEVVIRRALRTAGLTPDDISYIEAHGTGTPLGDPIELEALRKVFSGGSANHPCYLSSVKANIGHLETASGIASVIKVVLMMQRGQYVPQAEFRELNPHISLDGARLRIARAGSDWVPAKGVRRAGVSSFGFGGTNAHLILEEASSRDAATRPAASLAPAAALPSPSAGPSSDSVSADDLPLHLLALSARSSETLRTLAGHYAEYLQQHPQVDLEALCYTANAGRNHFAHRLTVTGSNAESLQKKLARQAAADGAVGHHHGFQTPKVAFLFTGQGGQYAGMGEQLFRTEPLFRQTLQHCDKILREPLGTSIIEVMHDGADLERISETRYTQPALFALEYSLATLWRAWGIEPFAMLGHSVGEYVAATLAGVFSLEDGLRLIARRAELMQRCPQHGTMAAVFASPQSIESLLAAPEFSSVAIAAYNGPTSTVISGDRQQVEAVVERLASEQVEAKFLPVSHAFHSPLMDEILDEFQEFASGIEMRNPQLPIISNLTGEVLERAPDAAYWRDHLRNPVRFEQGMHTLAGLGPDLMLEAGPSPNLLAMGRRFIAKENLEWLPSLRRGQGDQQVLLGSLARLYERGAKIRWAARFASPAPTKLTLPSYPFDRKRHWYAETGRPAHQTHRKPGGDRHPLLGAEFSTADGSRIFETQLHPQQPAYLAEHRVQGSAVTPAAAYLEQALAAADQLFGPGPHEVAAMSIQQAMFLRPEQPRQVQCSASEPQGDRGQIRIHSRESDAPASGDWTLHAVATLVRQTAKQQTVAAESDTEVVAETFAEAEAGSSNNGHHKASTNGASTNGASTNGASTNGHAHRVSDRIPSANAASANSASQASLAEPLASPRSTSKRNGKAVHRTALGPWHDAGERLETAIEGDAFYEMMRQQGLDYGPRFRVLSELRRGDGEAWAKVQLSDEVRQESGRHRIHPAILDGCLQAIAGVVPAAADSSVADRLYLPAAVEHFRLLGDPTTADAVYVRRCESQEETVIETVDSDVLLLDAHGDILAELKGVRVQSLGATATRSDDAAQRLYHIEWEPTASPMDATGNEAPSAKDDEKLAGTTWMILPGDAASLRSGKVAQRLCDRLRRLGARGVLVTPGDTFSVIDDDAFEIRFDRPEDYERLFAELSGDGAARCDGVIHLAPSDDELVADELFDPANSERLWQGALRLLQQLARTRISPTPPVWICTHGSQAIERGGDCDPGQAILWGFGRTAALEYPAPVRLIDLDPSAPASGSAEFLAAELSSGSDESQLAVRDGQRYAARLTQSDPEKLRRESASASGSSMSVPPAPFRLRFGRAGSFDELRLEPCRLPALGDDQVQLRVHSTGLNFSDVLKAMGLYPGITDKDPPLGIECAGVVTAVGKNVTRFAVGDRVMGVAPYSFASHALTADYTLTKMPEHLTYEEAATVPITFLTAHHALCSLARLQPGERVLIHAGAGGVGLAAIQIAQYVGAEIFATAGSDSKREFLRSLGVSHVFNSRTTEFAEQIMEVTDRAGVDVVLNSLPGEAIHKSLGILGPYGRFLEIGKTDIYQNQMIGLAPFQDNLSYFAIDLDRMLRQRPREIQRLFAEVMERLEQGDYRPLPQKTFAANETASAFRYMAQRKNVGKVVVSFSEAVEEADAEGDSQAPAEALPTIRSDASYLVTGGLGALGLRVARWLADAGAEWIVLAGRRAPSEAQQAELRQLPSHVNVCCIQADVSDESSLQSGLDQIPQRWPAIRGVIHAAGALADGLLYDMDAEQFQRALRPKVDGAWNLHRVSRDWPLDFFLLFSSVASVLGSPGQANYSAANAFLDALAAYRRARGLPATAINWGPWADGGMATAESRDDQLRQRGMRLLQPDMCLDLTERLIREEIGPQAIVMDVDWAALAKQFPSARPSLFKRFADHWESSAEGTTKQKVDRDFLERLENASGTDRRSLLQDYLAAELARILGTDPEDLEHDQPLSLVGIDSLMAMELRTNLESQLAIEVPMSILMDGPSICSLAGELLPLLGSPAAESDTDAEPVSKPTTASTARTSAALVPLQHHAVHPAIYCLHPIGGDLRCYQTLAKHLGEHRCVMTFRPRGADGTAPPHDNVEAMADEYRQLIRQYQPEGPYLLTGWSTGGIFAYELARQLREEGQPVELQFIDTPIGASLDHVDLDDDARFLYDLVKFSNWFSGARMEVDYEELKSLGTDRAIERVLAESKQQGVLPQGTSPADLERRIEMARLHVKAILQYEPQPLGQPVPLYRPEQSAVLALATGRQLSDDLGWEPILGSDLQIQRVGGDHFSMLTGQHGQRLADVLRKHIDQQLSQQA